MVLIKKNTHRKCFTFSQSQTGELRVLRKKKVIIQEFNLFVYLFINCQSQGESWERNLREKQQSDTGNLALTSGATRTGPNCTTLVRITTCAKSHHPSAWENRHDSSVYNEVRLKDFQFFQDAQSSWTPQGPGSQNSWKVIFKTSVCQEKYYCIGISGGISDLHFL